MRTSNGLVREISESNSIKTITTDDGKILDIDKKLEIICGNIWKIGSVLEIESQFIGKLLSNFNVPEKYKNASFEDFDKTHNGKSLKKLIEYYQSGYIKDNLYKSMIIWGENSGIGKTYSLYALGREWFNNPCVWLGFKKEFGEKLVIENKTVSYQVVREEDLMVRIRATFDDSRKETEQAIYDDLNKYSILGIDDIGKYKPSNMDFYRRVMFQIVDTRYSQGKGVIFSTNFTLNELAKYLGAPITDRLYEMSKGYQLTYAGDSHRVV
jgi:DNA replication protein DnaC